MKYKTEELLIITLAIVIFIAISLTINPNITGYTIFQPNLTYNENIIDGQLKQYSNTINYTTEQTYYYNLTFAEENEKDRLTKLIELDNNNLIFEKNNLLKIQFINELQNNDIINIYLQNNKVTTLNFCTFNTNNSCENQIIYASINYEGIENNYEVLLNLEEPTNQLSIDTIDNKIKIDYINASHLEITQHQNTTYYYIPSEIETEVIQPSNLNKWDIFTADYTLNNQTINFYYKTDREYLEFTPPKNFSEINSEKLQFKVFLNSDNSSTPIINNLIINYLENPCQENWTCTDWTDCINETQTRICTDLSECLTEENKPIEIQKCIVEEETPLNSEQPPSLTRFRSSSTITSSVETTPVSSPIKTETKTISQQIPLKAEEPEIQIEESIQKTSKVKVIGNSIALSYICFVCLLLYKRKHKL